jgi:hypothetical protein
MPDLMDGEKPDVSKHAALGVGKEPPVFLTLTFQGHTLTERVT